MLSHAPVHIGLVRLFTPDIFFARQYASYLQQVFVLGAGYYANRIFHSIFLTNQTGGGHHGFIPSVDSQVMPPYLDLLFVNLYFPDQQRKIINWYSAC